MNSNKCIYTLIFKSLTHPNQKNFAIFFYFQKIYFTIYSRKKKIILTFLPMFFVSSRISKTNIYIYIYIYIYNFLYLLRNHLDFMKKI